MSSGRTPTSDKPFGYDFKSEEFDSYDPNSFTTPYYPPPGPPLLDTNESDLLRSFFDNPNNVNSTSLSMPNEFHGDGSGLYGDANFDWIGGGAPGFGNASSSAMQGGGGVAAVAGMSSSQRFPSSNNLFSNMANQGSMQATDDVYAAAQLLHNNQSRSNGQLYGSQALGGGYNTHQPPSSSAPYDMPNTSMMNDMINSLQLSQSGNPNSVDFAASMGGRVNGWTGDARAGPLRFGSDDNFRANTYLPPSTEAPDKELTEAVAQHFQYNREIQQSGLSEPNSPIDTPKKRGRPSLIHTHSRSSEEDEQSSEAGDATQKKRRKSMIQGRADFDAYLDDGDDPTGVKSKMIRKQRRQSKSKATMDAERPSLQKRTKSSDGPGKGPRENLTEEQKRSNHIQSEQKRRNLIKQGFEDLNRLVPELRAGGFSKSNMLLEVARFMRTMQEGNDELRALIDSMDNG